MELRRQLDAKRLLCLFVGNSDTQKGDRYWELKTGQININRDVTPISHHYKPRSSQANEQNGVDVFKPNESPATKTTPAPEANKSTDSQNILEEQQPSNESVELDGPQFSLPENRPISLPTRQNHRPSTNPVDSYVKGNQRSSFPCQRLSPRRRQSPTTIKTP